MCMLEILSDVHLSMRIHFDSFASLRHAITYQVDRDRSFDYDETAPGKFLQKIKSLEEDAAPVIKVGMTGVLR